MKIRLSNIQRHDISIKTHNSDYNIFGHKYQHFIKLPTIILGIPHLSLCIVKEKQQLTNPSSVGTSSCCASDAFAVAEFEFIDPVLKIGL